MDITTTDPSVNWQERASANAFSFPLQYAISLSLSRSLLKKKSHSQEALDTHFCCLMMTYIDLEKNFRPPSICDCRFIRHHLRERPFYLVKIQRKANLGRQASDHTFFTLNCPHQI